MEALRMYTFQEFKEATDVEVTPLDVGELLLFRTSQGDLSGRVVAVEAEQGRVLVSFQIGDPPWAGPSAEDMPVHAETQSDGPPKLPPLPPFLQSMKDQADARLAQSDSQYWQNTENRRHNALHVLLALHSADALSLRGLSLDAILDHAQQVYEWLDEGKRATPVPEWFRE